MVVAVGVNPKELSVRAGHSSVAFTLDRYGHLYEDAGEDVPDCLDALLGGRATSPAFPKQGTKSLAFLWVGLTCSFEEWPHRI
jgi:hypothetical protein